jgi:hypothetical protein
MKKKKTKPVAFNPPKNIFFVLNIFCKKTLVARFYFLPKHLVFKKEKSIILFYFSEKKCWGKTPQKIS